MESYVALGAVVGGTAVVLFWVSLVVWTYRDIRDRSQDLAIQVLSVFLVMAFSLIGLLLYLILRPRETMDEAYARSLEEEALLREIGPDSACPSCRRSVEKDFLYCPHCQTQLREACGHCGRPLSFSWLGCPSCGTGRGAPARAAQPASGVATADIPVLEGLPSSAGKAAKAAKAAKVPPSL